MFTSLFIYFSTHGYYCNHYLLLQIPVGSLVCGERWHKVYDSFLFHYLRKSFRSSLWCTAPPCGILVTPGRGGVPVGCLSGKYKAKQNKTKRKRFHAGGRTHIFDPNCAVGAVLFFQLGRTISVNEPSKPPLWHGAHGFVVSAVSV